MRNHLPIAALAALIALTMPSCTGGQLDTTKVQDGIKTACGLAVTAASILSITQLDPTMSISAIVNLICSNFKQLQAAGKLGSGLASGTEITIPIEVKGQTVNVRGTVV